MRIAQCCFAALFLLAAAVQYNDPDPGRWAVIYLAAAAVSAAAASVPRWQRPPLDASPLRHAVVRFGAMLVAVVAALWAAGIWAGGEHPLVVWRMFDQWEMRDIAVEETREIFGLLIVAAWMSITVLMPRGSQANASTVQRRPPRT